MGVLLQQGHARHDDAVAAIAALCSLFGNEGGLHRVRLLRCTQSFEGDDGFALCRRHWKCAGTHRLTINQHCATAALTQTAAEFRPKQSELVAQDIEQWLIRIPGAYIVPLAIDLQTVISHLQHLRSGTSIIYPARIVRENNPVLNSD
jgi:hypothetical protein